MKNSVAKTLHYIGLAGIVIGLIAGVILIIVAEGESIGWTIGIVVILGCFMEGMVFVGLAETIGLLQCSIDQQKELMKFFKQRDSDAEKNTSFRNVIEDIESDLPRL